MSYYFAKKGINERRAEQDAAGTRPSEKLDCKYSFNHATARVIAQVSYRIGRARIEKDEFQGAPKEKFEQAKDKTNSEAVGKVNHATGNPTLEETPGKTQGTLLL